MTGQITIIGSLNYDLVTFTNRIPDGGETIQAGAFESHLGGKGLNETIATARLTGEKSGVNIRMIGNVGDDAFGKELKDAVEDSGADGSNIKVLKGESSGTATILVEESGENRILIVSGANGKLKPENEDYARYFPRESPFEREFVILQNEYPDTAKSINWLKTNRPDINIAYNPSPIKEDLINTTILSQVDLLIVNEGEAEEISGHLLSKDGLKRFEQTLNENRIDAFKLLSSELKKQICPSNINTVIITLGSLGSVFSSCDNEASFAHSNKVEKVVDTTGAGDTFFGAVVSKLASESSLSEAVAFASLASSLVITKKGAVESIPTIKDVEELQK